MTKKDMIKILCQNFGYKKDILEEKSYADVKKIYIDENLEQRSCSADDDADLFPNGRDYEAENEEFL